MKFRSGQIALTGGLFILLLASGCQGRAGQSGQTSIFSSEADSHLFLAGQAVSKPTFTVPVDPVFGAIISPEFAVAEKFLANVPRADEYETVILLAPTQHRTETHRIFTYKEPGILKQYGVNFDAEIIEKLEKSNAVAVLPQVPDQSYWNADLVRNLKTYFPKAGFVTVSLNESLPDFEARILGSLLKSHLSAKSIVIALADFQAGPNENIRDFQQRFTRTVLQSADTDRFDELPTESTVALKTLGYYLRFRQAQKIGNLLPARDQQESGEDFQATYVQGQPEKTDSIYVVAFGDIMLGRYVRYLMDQNGPDYPFEQMDDSYLRVNDILVANLEGPVTEKAVRTTAGMSFGFFPDVAPLLKKHYFDVLSQANNHTLDKRQEGYDQSMQFLRNEGLIAFGYPKEINQDSVAKVHIRGQQMAFIGLEEVLNKINDEEAVKLVTSLMDEGYKVIPFIHWGTEYVNRPNSRQQELAHKLIDAGATAIIGHHPHVPQTFEIYNGRPIFYSLGNAIFDQYWSAETQKGLSVALIISDTGTEIFFLPLSIDRSQMKIMDEKESQKFLEKFVTYGNYSDEEKAGLLEGHLTL